MSTFVNTDPTAFKGVWVFCEQREGKLMPTDFELISEGRKLADDLGVELCGLLLGACTQRQTTLKFMSYNIRNGRGIDNVQDLGRVAEIINRTAPDIVALQELDSVTGRMAGRFIPGELGEMTGMHARFCRAIDYDGGAYGVGLLSRAAPRAGRRLPRPGPAYCSSPSFPATWSASPTSRLRPRTSARRCRSSARSPTPAANRCCWPETST